MSGYFHNVVISSILNDVGQQTNNDSGGLMFYLSTSGSWSEDYVITARALPQFGGTLSLKGGRYIKDTHADISRNDGPLYVWAEMTETTVGEDVELRISMEAWGRGILLENQ